MGQYLNVPDPLLSFFSPANLPAAVSHSLSPALQFASQHSAYPATVFRHSSKRKREGERECAPQTALPVSASVPRPRCTVSQPSLKEAQLPPPHFSQLFCLDMIVSIVIFLLTRPSQYYPHTDLYQRLRLGNSDGEFARLATLLGIDAAVNSSDRVFGICNSAIRWCIRDIFAVAQRQGLLRHHAHSEYTLDHWEWCGVTAVWAQPQHRAAVVY